MAPREEYRSALRLGVELLPAEVRGALHVALTCKPMQTARLVRRYGGAGLVAAAAVVLGHATVDDFGEGNARGLPPALLRELRGLPRRARVELDYGWRHLDAVLGETEAANELQAVLARMLARSETSAQALVPVGSSSILATVDPAAGAAAVRVDVSRRIQRQLHAEIGRLVRSASATAGIDPAAVQVLVRAGRSMQGRTWPGVTVPSLLLEGLLPRLPSLRPHSRLRRWYGIATETRWLVVLTIPPDPTRGSYPKHERLYRDGGPTFSFRAWQEELYALTAHEAHHVAAYQAGRRPSELAAEWHAAIALGVHSRALPRGGQGFGGLEEVA
jgi:hypothetical protein